MIKGMPYELKVMAITEMVHNLIWAPDFFGPGEIWALKILGPKNFGPFMKLQYNDFHAGHKFFRA